MRVLPRFLLVGWFAIVLATSACGNSEPDTEPSPPPKSSTSSESSGRDPGEDDLALLSRGDSPSFASHDDYEQSGTLGVREGCVTLILDTGEEMLLFAPYKSTVEAEPPRIRLSDGDAYDIGDEVRLIGQARDMWRASGPSAPAAWERCVGGRQDHEVMFVIGT
jgi:hypothetical protein